MDSGQAKSGPSLGGMGRGNGGGRGELAVEVVEERLGSDGASNGPLEHTGCDAERPGAMGPLEAFLSKRCPGSGTESELSTASAVSKTSAKSSGSNFRSSVAESRAPSKNGPVPPKELR